MTSTSVVIPPKTSRTVIVPIKEIKWDPTRKVHLIPWPGDQVLPEEGERVCVNLCACTVESLDGRIVRCVKRGDIIKTWFATARAALRDPIWSADGEEHLMKIHRLAYKEMRARLDDVDATCFDVLKVWGTDLPGALHDMEQIRLMLVGAIPWRDPESWCRFIIPTDPRSTNVVDGVIGSLRRWINRRKSAERVVFKMQRQRAFLRRRLKKAQLSSLRRERS